MLALPFALVGGLIALYEGVETNCTYHRLGPGLELVQRHPD
jgi:hypothetical protein